MKRIGIAASTISKGNMVLYHFYVVLISALFSLSIFVVAGAVVVFALVIIKYVGSEIMGQEFERSWRSVLAVCMTALTVITTLFTVFAVSQNIKFPHWKR